MKPLSVIAAIGLVLLGLAPGPTPAQSDAITVRVATYNVALNRDGPSALRDELTGGASAQARALAEVIQAVRPDILLVNEIDRDPDGAAADLFGRLYLGLGQNGRAPLHYPYLLVPPVNTGVPSGLDLDRDGQIGGPGDAWGFGAFPGQFGLALYSRFPIAQDAVRTFQTLEWQDMPGALLFDRAAGGVPLAGPGGFYDDATAARLRLSSKTHADIPVQIGETRLHLLVSHPTPPVFDGPEDRNGKRNHDEIRFWADYVSGAGWMTDDAGRSGGLGAPARFVILGDLNADPFDGDSVRGAVRQLLSHPRVLGSAEDPALVPMGAGSLDQPGETATHEGDPRFDTADFGPRPGNLRVDYVLPSRFGLRWVDAGVVWPRVGAPLSEAVTASDHRLVWVDLEILPPE